jgi:hypothetical protein
MKNFTSFISLLSILLVLGGCASGKKALQKGDYSKAVSQAINKLRSNDDHKKARATLGKAYKYATEIYLSNIAQAKGSSDELKWESVSANYERINYMYNEIVRCPACREVVPNPIRFDSELEVANKNAAAARYELGLRALEMKRNRDKAIEAHQHFMKAQSFVPRYKDVEEKLSEAMFYATLKVVVEPIPSPFKALDISHEFFVNKINERLHRDSFNDYVRFYTPSEAKADKLEFVDHVIRMEFDHFTLGNVFSEKDTREVSRDSVNLAGKNEPPYYGTVKAKLTKHTKSITGGGVLDFRIFDNQLNKIVTQEKFPSEYIWSIQWATYKGDERALTKEELELCELTDLPIPSPQRMFEEFTAPLYDQVISKIRAYYRRY